MSIDISRISRNLKLLEKNKTYFNYFFNREHYKSENITVSEIVSHYFSFDFSKFTKDFLEELTDFGEIVHTGVQQKAVEYWSSEFFPEFRVEVDFGFCKNVVGKIDLLAYAGIDYLERKTYVDVIEIKTSYDRNKRKPYDSHIFQVLVYAVLLEEQGIGINSIQIWYIGKKQYFWEIPLSIYHVFKKGIKQKILEYVKLVCGKIENDIPESKKV